MRPIHRVLFVLAAFAAFQGVQACASETPDPGLNPQPLPPEQGDDKNRGPEEANEPGQSTGGGATSSSSSGGSSGGAPPVAADGDAGDAGKDSSGDN